MTIGSILLSVALFIIFIGYLARPFFIKEQEDTPRSRRLDLLAQKDQILADIQALDFEFETGTVSEPEYRQQRYFMVQDAALLLRKFEQSLPQKSMSDDEIDAKIEAAIAKIRGIEPTGIEIPCPECGAATKQGDKFCATCGFNLQEGATA